MSFEHSLIVYQSARSNNAQDYNFNKIFVFANAFLKRGDACQRNVVKEKLAKTA